MPAQPTAPESAAPALRGSLDLLRKALETGDSTRELSRKIGMGANALNVARSRGRLSPTAAGTIATHIGEDPTLWVSVAALEAEPPTPQRDRLLKRLIANWRKR